MAGLVPIARNGYQPVNLAHVSKGKPALIQITFRTNVKFAQVRQCALFYLVLSSFLTVDGCEIIGKPIVGSGTSVFYCTMSLTVTTSYSYTHSI